MRTLCFLLLAALLLASGCSMIPRQPLSPLGGQRGLKTTAATKAAPGSSIVATARSQMGVPYSWGGDSPREGFDCSGFAWWVFRQNGMDLPRPSWEQYRTGREVARRELRPGDLVFFRIRTSGRSLHVGIVSSPGRFIHSPRAGGVIIESSLENAFWKRHFIGGRRVSA